MSIPDDRDHPEPFLKQTDIVALQRQKLVGVRGWLQADPMFDGLKGAPEFEALISVQ